MARRETIFLFRPGTGDYGSNWRVYAEGLTPASAILTTKALEAQGEVVMRVRTAKVLGKQTYLTPTSYDQMTASTMTVKVCRK